MKKILLVLVVGVVLQGCEQNTHSVKIVSKHNNSTYVDLLVTQMYGFKLYDAVTEKGDTITVNVTGPLQNKKTPYQADMEKKYTERYGTIQ